MATVSFSTTFKLTLSPKQFVFVDTSDYAGQGISTSNVNGCFTIVAPSGVTVWDNTDFSNSGCDIKVSTSTTVQKIIPLPISAGLVESGTYQIVYTVRDSNLNVDYTATANVDYEYIAPIVEISQVVNVIAPIFSQTDDTNYVVGGITPTIIRENKMIYPQGIEGGPPAPIITSAKTLRTTVVYNGPVTSTVTSDVTYSFSNYTVIDQLFGSKYVTVDGSYYCSLLCGLKAYEKKVRGCDDSVLKAKYKANFNLAMSYLSLINASVECNGSEGVSEYKNQIYDIIGDCDCGCNGESEQFSRITGWGTIIGADGEDGGDGLSAYEIAVANGYVGSETQWLASLNGSNSSVILYNNLTPQVTSGTTPTIVSYTIPANTLATNGSLVALLFDVKKTVATDIFNIVVALGGTDITTAVTMPYFFGSGAQKISSLVNINRVAASGANSAYITEVNNLAASNGQGATVPFYSSGNMTLDFTASIVLTVTVTRTSGTGTATINQVLLTSLNKA